MNYAKSRREFLKLASSGTVSFIIIPSTVFNHLHSLLKAQKKGDVLECDPDKLQLTALEEFFVISVPPKLPSLEDYRVEVSGLVSTKKIFAYEEITAMPSVTMRSTLECIGNSIGGGNIGNAEWTGTRLKNVMDIVKVNPFTSYVVCYGYDSYSSSAGADNYSAYIPVAVAERDNVIIAWNMNGKALTPNHGWPFRIIVPSYYGYKNTKWLKKLEFVIDVSNIGSYEQGGWSKDGVMKPTSAFISKSGYWKITNSVELCGIGLGPVEGIEKIQVSADNGFSWRDAEIVYRGAQVEWVLWKYVWEPLESDFYDLTVRAIFKDGTAQTSTRVSAFPNGASGLHRINVQIELDTTPVWEDEEEKIPRNFALNQNYPNPFNSQTVLTFNVPYAAPVSIVIYNIMGMHIKTLVRGIYQPGIHTVSWDGTNGNGKRAASGNYMVRMQSDIFSQTIKITFLG